MKVRPVLVPHGLWAARETCDTGLPFLKLSTGLPFLKLSPKSCDI